MPSTQSTTKPRARYGTIAAKIGTMHAHRLAKAFTFQHRNAQTHEPMVDPQGAPVTYRVPAGKVVHLEVEDLTRHPAEVRESAKWVCRSPHCAQRMVDLGGGWKSKAELLADHADNRALDKQEEIHLYMAVAEIAGVDAAPMKKDAKGVILQDAVTAQLPRLVLLSDES